MKKGLINLILLVLVVTNVVLTAILVFAVVPAMNAATDLIGKVAQGIDLEKELKDANSDTISIDKTETFSFAEKITIQLKTDNGQESYAQFQLTLRLNTEDEAYSKYKDKLTANEQLMRAEVNRVVAMYTGDQLLSNTSQAATDVRDALRKLFNETEFIYDVNFSDLVIQER
ncbi:MAG: flagellar basal body-associated FliL family protein [Lachnospiraceae bacterium]|nr:flagellar basal body-associated FliL family protein [Lachnospiraceae bacterium]